LPFPGTIQFSLVGQQLSNDCDIPGKGTGSDFNETGNAAVKKSHITSKGPPTLSSFGLRGSCCYQCGFFGNLIFACAWWGRDELWAVGIGGMLSLTIATSRGRYGVTLQCASSIVILLL